MEAIGHNIQDICDNSDMIIRVKCIHNLGVGVDMVKNILQ